MRRAFTSRVARRAFAALIRCYPFEFRRRFGDDMRSLFDDQLLDAESVGTLGVARFLLRTFAATTLSIGAAWLELIAPARAPHSARGDGMTTIIGADIRYAARSLSKQPLFTFVAIAVIAIGTGAVTTIASAVNAMILRPIPGATDPDRLIAFDRRSADGREGASVSYHLYERLRDRSHMLTGVAAWSKADMTLSTGGAGTTVAGNLVSGNYFSVLGLRPTAGRFFLREEDDVPLAHPVVVVSYRYWTIDLGRDSSAIGKPLWVNGNQYTLIGVAPRGFHGVFSAIRVDAWAPLAMQPQLRPQRDLADDPWLWTFGRLRAGATHDAARTELTSIIAAHAVETGLAREYTKARIWSGFSLPEDAHVMFLSFAAVLFGAAGLVLVIACVNVASMLSARAMARRREMAVRAALGAGRARLVRQLLTESIMLSGAGALAGVGVAWIASSLLESLPLPVDQALMLELTPDPRVLAFAAVLSVVTGIVFGLAPALRGTSADVAARLREDNAASAGGKRHAGNALIVAQLALALTLLVTAGLFARSLVAGTSIDPGFDVAHVATLRMNTEAWGYTPDQGRAFYREFRRRVAALPGVDAVSSTTVVPLAAQGSSARIDASAFGESPKLTVSTSTIDPGYFTVLGIPLVRGRAIDATDDERAAPVVVINETLERRLTASRGGTALGRTFGFGSRRVTVVGVARDAKYDDLSATPPVVFVPLAQQWMPTQTILVRAKSSPSALAPALDRVASGIDPHAPHVVVVPMEAATSTALLPQRVAGGFTGVLGVIGLILASVGLYGTIAYSVGRRTREIGIRVALGAHSGTVLAMILREGMLLASLGLAIGLGLAALVTRLVSRYLVGVSALDALTFGSMAALLAFVALAASYIPARRAAAIDPVRALKME
jgi:putative ABC transport system permease protein